MDDTKTPEKKAAAPFYRLEFTQITSAGRSWIQVTQVDDEAYEVKTEEGPHAHAVPNEFRVSLPSVASLRDKMAKIGVFGWDESYGDAPAVPQLSWGLVIVFQKDVFTMSSHGGSDVPLGFDKLVELLRAAGMPKPSRGTQPQQRPAFFNPFLGGMGFPMPGGQAPRPSSAPPTPSTSQSGSGTQTPKDAQSGQTGQGPQGPSGAPFDLEGLMGAINPQVMAQMQAALQTMRDHPEQFQQEMRREFGALDADQQDQLLDFLSTSGIGNRAWWENFLRG